MQRPAAWLLGAWLVFASAPGTAAGDARPRDDLLQMPLEQLLDVEVVSASKYGQSVNDAPASVTVVTAEDIHTFGYRSLADALAAVRGFHITGDHIYSYAGVRGFSPPGDYNDRLLVMVDGHRINENIYDQAALDTDFPVDLDLVERIEVIRGPGSSLYGSNALLGVVNVVTKKGESLGTTEIALAAGKNRLDKERLSWGRKLDNGADVLLSASKMRTAGGTVNFPDLNSPVYNGGSTSGTDWDHNASVFGKFSLDGLSLEGAWSRRDKGSPSSYTGTVFGDPASFLRDEMAFLDGRYRSRLGEGSEAEIRLFAGSYDYTGHYLYPAASSSDPATLNVDTARGRWWGGEARLLADLGAHRLTLGVEYQNNLRQQQRNRDAGSDTLNLDETRSSRRTGFYMQDDFRVSDTVTLSAGVRHDVSSGAQALTSPRLAAVWRATPATVAKLLYGSAFRIPNAYELFYTYPAQQEANPELRPERIRTLEAIVEHYLNPDLRLTLAGYFYRMHDQIAQVTNPDNGLLQYRNQGDIDGHGLEMEAEQRFANGARLRGSLSWQRATDLAGQALQNAPTRLAKASLSWPLAGGWRLGLEEQAISQRMTWLGRVPGYGIANLTVLRPMGADGWEFSMSVHNLLDRRTLDPAGNDPGFQSLPDTSQRDSLPGPRRDWRLKLVRRF